MIVSILCSLIVGGVAGFLGACLGCMVMGAMVTRKLRGIVAAKKKVGAK